MVHEITYGSFDFSAIIWITMAIQGLISIKFKGKLDRNPDLEIWVHQTENPGLCIKIDLLLFFIWFAENKTLITLQI